MGSTETSSVELVYNDEMYVTCEGKRLPCESRWLAPTDGRGGALPLAGRELMSFLVAGAV